MVYTKPTGPVSPFDNGRTCAKQPPPFLVDRETGAGVEGPQGTCPAETWPVLRKPQRPGAPVRRGRRSEDESASNRAGAHT